MAAPAGGSVQDTPKLEYKLHRKFKVFNTNNHYPDLIYNLVASSTTHGVIFVASTDGLLAVYRVAELLYSEADPPRVTVKLPERPERIAVNCDGELLAVVGPGEKSILIYNVKDFRNQDASPKLSVPRGSSWSTCDMQWSPSMNETLAIGFYDKITILHVGTGKRIDNTDNSVTRCLSWHPSGSSLVVGDGDGTLSVYSPDLSLQKCIPAPAPPLFDGASLCVRAVHWLSSNQFAVVYGNTDTAGCESVVTLINAPEGELPPRAEYVGRLESDSYCPFYNLLQIKPWLLLGLPRYCSASAMFAHARTQSFGAVLRRRVASLMCRVRGSANTVLRIISDKPDCPIQRHWNVILCAPLDAGVKLLPPDSDEGGSQAPVQLVSELLREDDMYALGVALDRVPVLRLSSQSHLHKPTEETITLLHVLTVKGDLATYTVGERPSTPSVDTESSRTTPGSEPAALEPPLIYSNKEAAECAAAAAEHEGGARARAARRLDETALARLSRLTLAQDPPPAPAEERSPGGAPASFCGPCAALVGPAERERHARSLQHRSAVFAERELEELVREYVAERDLALLGPPAGAASQADDSLVELSDASGWYRCELCAERVPRGARCVHERGRRHGACAALAHAALRRPGPLCGARVSDRGLRALLQLYCGEQAPAPDAEGADIHNVD